MLRARLFRGRMGRAEAESGEKTPSGDSNETRFVKAYPKMDSEHHSCRLNVESFLAPKLFNICARNLYEAPVGQISNFLDAKVNNAARHRTNYF
jgi:hypothetical protein